MQYISPQVWEEFNRRFPDAARFLRHESLRGELAGLQQQENPNPWQCRRMTELTELFKSRAQMEAANV
jgi:hypothetical protein